jgi:endonuclease/exonuclease/phosphatase family metal-dependent hydrolase
LMPGVREFVGQAVGIFEERLQGWVWLFLLVLMLIVGNRLNGLGAAAALVLAQFIAITLLWWIPTAPVHDEVEQVGPSISFGLFILVIFVYLYYLMTSTALVPAVLVGQWIAPLIAAGILLGIPRLFWREVDPWTEGISLPRSLPAAFVAPIVVIGLMLGSSRAAAASPTLGDLRVATYNINSGYDEAGVFQLELAARTIEASVADVVLIQGADIGRPTSYGGDEAVYLAKRLGMYQAYISTTDNVEGISVLSRWPLTDIHAVSLGESLQIGALRVRVTDPTSQRTLDLLSAELQPQADEQRRLQQLAYLFSLLDPSVPSVLGVDLGAGTSDIAYQQLTAVSFIDPDTVLGIERGFTYPTSSPVERRDFVLIRGLIPVESRHVESPASSHRLVVVALKWP